MTSQIETGHARNVANFRALIEHCNAYGAAYNPTNAAITIAALQTKLSAAEQALAAHRAVKVEHDNAANTRERLFKNLQPLATRIMGALTASGAQALTLADAKTILRRLRGQRAGKKTLPAPPADIPGETPADALVTLHRNVSASQRSYDQQLEHFSRLVQIVQTESLYNPNESDLSITGLQAHLSELGNATAQVAVLNASYTASVTQRNTVLYHTDTGLPALARAVKAYVKSLYGQTSSQYAAVKGISIRNGA